MVCGEYFLGKIAEGEVYWVRRFVAKCRELRFVGGYDDGHYGRISLLGRVFDRVLIGRHDVNSSLCTSEMHDFVPGFSTTTLRYACHGTSELSDLHQRIAAQVRG